MAQAATGEAKPGRGRPTKKTTALIDRFCQGLTEGKSALVMCSECEISWQTLATWLRDDPDFLDKYRVAREIQADYLAEETLDIADQDPLLAITNQGGANEGDVIRVDGAAVQHQKLRIDTRKWYASIVAPRKYGTRVNQQQLDKNGEPADAPAAQPIINVSFDRGAPNGQAAPAKRPAKGAGSKQSRK